MLQANSRRRPGHCRSVGFDATGRVASDAHRVGALLYVARNPLAARIVKRAENWRYSSYRATVGLEQPPRWLVLGEVLPLFGSTRAKAESEFARLVHRGPLPVSDTDWEPLGPGDVTI